MSRVPMSLFHAAAEREKEEAQQHHVEMIKEGQVSLFEIKGNKEADDAMLEQVIARIQVEMEAKQSNAYVQATGEQMINFLTNHPEVAQQMTDETKSIEASYSAVEQFARNLGNRTAMVTPQQTFEAIMKYYGVIGAVIPVAAVTLPATPDAAIKETIEEPSAPLEAAPVKQAKKRFDASMDDFW